jgi:hypothetical protein
LSFDSGVLDEGSGVSDETTGCAGDVRVDLGKLFGSVRLASEIFSILFGSMRVELSFLWTARTTPSVTLMPTAEVPLLGSWELKLIYLDGLHSVLDLEKSSFGREGVNTTVVLVSKFVRRARIGTCWRTFSLRCIWIYW